MSTQSGPLPVSVVIFDRSQRGLSDVPTFSQALKEKVNAPSQELLTPHFSAGAQAILAKAGLLDSTHPQSTSNSVEHTSETSLKIQEDSPFRADPVRGQTTGFAQSGEVSDVDVPIKSEETGLQESPSIIRWAQGNFAFEEIADKVVKKDLILEKNRVETIQNTPEFSSSAEKTKVEIVIPPQSHVSLRSEHTAGLIDQVVLPNIRHGFILSFEEYLYAVQRTIKKTPFIVLSIRARLQTLLIARTRLLFLLSTEKKDDFKMFASRLKNSYQRLLRISVTGLSNRITFLQNKALSLVAKIQEKIAGKRDTLTTIHVVSDGFRVSHFASRLMIAGSLVMMLLTVGPMVALEAHSWKERLLYSLTPKAVDMSSIQNLMKSPTPTPKPTPVANPDPERQFQIRIPKIGVDSKVIANVDAGNEKEYSLALKKGVAHAAGTGLPGEANTTNKTIFIFGHSTNEAWNITRYNALFYSLKDLIIGDDIHIWFWDKEFHYSVVERKIVEANDVSFLEPQTDEDTLILQTCWPPGTTWKRLVVVAKAK